MPRKVLIGYLFLLWVTLLNNTVGLVVRSWRALQNPFQLDYGEGIVIWQAQHITNLKMAYHNISQFPHVVFQYPPVYHLVSRLFEPATGDLLRAGRLVSILSTLGIGFFSGLIVWSVLPRKMPLSIRATAVAAGAGLSYSIYPLYWAVYMRVDMLALFLEFAGIYLYLQGSRRPWLEYAAFFSFFLALYTRQTTIAGPLACGIVTLLVEPKKAVRQLCLLVACGGVTMAFLVLVTEGQFFRHLFLYTMNPYSVSALLSNLKPNLASLCSVAAAALALPIAYVAGLLSRPSGRFARFRAAMLHSPSHRFIVLGGLFLIIAGGVSLTAGKTGATDNYMLEWNLAACPLAAILLAEVLQWCPRHARLLPTCAAILLSPVLYTLGNLSVSSFTGDDWVVDTDQQSAAIVLDRIRQVEGPVYSTDMVLLYRAGKSIAAEPFMISVLAEQKRWDDTPFANRIDSGFFDLIVTTTPLSYRVMYSPRVEAAIERAYELRETIGGYTLYRPRDSVRASSHAK